MKRWIGIFLALAFALQGCGLTEGVVQPDSVTVPATQPPRPEPQPATQAADLSDVSHWLYLIDVDLEDELVDVIAESTYDMAVIDYIPSEADNADFPISEVIAAWHGANHPKNERAPAAGSTSYVVPPRHAAALLGS